MHDTGLRVFSYWHQPDSMPAYLHACLATWQPHVEGPVLLTDANLGDWLPAGTLNFQALREYPLSQQKDAIEVAMLARYGGIFLDVDTLMMAPPLQLQAALQSSSLAMYGYHLAALAARPRSGTLRRWLDIIQRLLELPREELIAANPDRYFQLGNYSYELLREELATGKPVPLLPGDTPWLRRLKGVRRRLAQATYLRGKLRHLDPDISGYLPETRALRGKRLSARRAYEHFWFESTLPVSSALRPGSSLIALHHSWTPDWFRNLDSGQLHSHDCLLARSLRECLRSQGQLTTKPLTDKNGGAAPRS